MKIEQHELDSVEKKLNKQNALKAALAVSLWCMPIFVSWYLVFQFYSQFAPIYLLVSGALVGLAVRLHGKGYSVLFSIIAFLAHALLVASAFQYNLLLAPGDSIWAIFLLGLYASGAWLSAYIGRIQVPFLEHKAFYQLDQQNKHSSSKKLINRWFVALPIVVPLCASLLVFSMFVLIIIDESTALAEANQQTQQKRKAFNSRAIDVRPESLKNLSVKQALVHAYAFHTGQLPNDFGYNISKYPKSTFKAMTILKYLSEKRNTARAKYILGLLTIENNGTLLIREAANEGDNYAKLHVATQYACNGKPAIATDLLRRLKSTMRDDLVLNQIDQVLSFGFDEACDEENSSLFLLEYATSA